ncbi:unnamed protein product [Sphagnum jensenii]|uniref:Uncharacterized protein n=1 Tax=Sphagnum jensenii TaxID=128206 RepID=A0ABP0W9L1_9BRYO
MLVCGQNIVFSVQEDKTGGPSDPHRSYAGTLNSKMPGNPLGGRNGGAGIHHQEKEIEACSEAVEIPPGFECIAVAATASISSGPSFADTTSLKELDLLPGFDGVAGSDSHGFTFGSGRQARDVDRTSEGTVNKACPYDMGEDSFLTSASVPISSPSGHAQLPFLAKQQTAEEAEVLLLSSKESEKLKSA